MTSNIYTQRASLLPAATSTLAKSPSYANGILHSMFAVAASGAYFTDSDGDQWLDFDMGLGSVVWGHSPARIVDSIVRQANLGICLSVPSVLEGELAERILNRLDDFEQIQFAKNGADVTTAAVRLARAVTGRKGILMGRYHGWHDWSAVHHYGQPNRLGISEDVAQASLWLERENAELVAETLENHRDVAAIIVCPEHWNIASLREVRRLASHYGVVLIFDEVKAGIRYGPRGVYGAFNVVPDLLCLGKGLANGMPLAALVGSRGLMQHLPDIRFSSTHATEALSMAAAIVGEEMLAETSCWPLWEGSARNAMRNLSSSIKNFNLTDELAVHGYSGSFWIGTPDGKVAPEFQKQFVQALANEKIFSRGYIVPSAVHRPEEIDRACMVAVDTLAIWSKRR